MTKNVDLINVAVVGDGLYTWGGGIDFTRLVVGSMDPSRYRPRLYLPSRRGFGIGTMVNAALYPVINRLSSETFVDDMYDRVATDLRRNLDHREDLVCSLSELVPGLDVQYYTDDIDLIRRVRRDGVSLVLPTARMLGSRFPVPWVPFLNDLQHKYYPEYFSHGSRAFRDRDARRLLRSTKNVIASSVAVKDDANRFYPDHGCCIHAIPFAAPRPKYDPSPDVRTVKERYGIDRPYFIVMNQFWRHKNHMVVLKALAELRSRGELDFSLVFTGRTEDQRFPEYYPGLLRFVEKENLEDAVKVVGFVPKKDQVCLMHGARAVVQPTLFEGGPGGLASVDAASYGIPILLSDIPVNHYVDGVETEFFAPDDAHTLARMMQERSGKERRPRSMEELRENAEKGEVRLRKFIDGVIASALGHGSDAELH